LYRKDWPIAVKLRLVGAQAGLVSVQVGLVAGRNNKGRSCGLYQVKRNLFLFRFWIWQVGD
jgi:hypothetical protein